MALVDRMALVALTAVLMAALVSAGRYKSCQSGCCKNEFCAYDSICYPVSQCKLGCPDGECVEDGASHQSCMPHSPCKSSYECSPGHACTQNYNLGYSTCQYDLGDGLCPRGESGQHGSDAAEQAWKRSFLARWRGKAAYVRPSGGKFRG